MEKKKCVLIGTGSRGIASYIRPLVEGHLKEHVALLGICDAVKSRAVACSQEYGNIPVYDDFETMLNMVKPDFVIVTTMDSNHHIYVIKALDMGYDVITEKPITNTREKARAIMEAEKRSGKTVRVIFNMRYMNHVEQLKRVLSSGVIGQIRHIDFTWLLDRSHGADYFRRWHRKMENTTSLLVHKSTHHFDMINWVTGKVPASVFARGTLEFYGKNGPYRGKNCRNCDHAAQCPFHIDITDNDYLRRYFIDVEPESGYFRDGCVFDEEIDIFDRMALNVRFTDGATMNYSLTCYNPDEGFRAYFTGTKGRVEITSFSSGPQWSETTKIKIITPDGAAPVGLTSYVGGSTGSAVEQIVEVTRGSGTHGGSDAKMLDVLFGLNTDPDPLGRGAGSYEGYLSLAIGDMAAESIRTGREVFLEPLP